MWRALILVILLVVVLPATMTAHARKAPNLKLKDLRGRDFRLSSYKGKVVLLNFWATWCPPCRAEMPDLVRWQREYRGRGLQVVGVTYPPTNRGEVRRFVHGLRINYPVVYGTRKTRALFDKGETLPITVVIDRKGNISEIIEGILLAEEFAEKIAPLLGQSNRENEHRNMLKHSFLQ